MTNPYSLDDLLEFLDHAGDRGLMPTATARALAVAARQVFDVLGEDERSDLGSQDLAAVIKRFTNKRAKDFNPTSLKEYGRRVQRAVNLFLRWRDDPANFAVKTRHTVAGRSSRGRADVHAATGLTDIGGFGTMPASATYESSVPVRPGVVVTVRNVPYDLTAAEAERIASFVRLLAVPTASHNA